MFILALYLDDRYLSSADGHFVELVQSDIEDYLTSVDREIVLLFPPVDNYHRLLIHKTAQSYSDLYSFSVGEGSARRSVVCLKQTIKSEAWEELMSSQRPPPQRGWGRGRGRQRNFNSPQGSPSGRESPHARHRYQEERWEEDRRAISCTDQHDKFEPWEDDRRASNTYQDNRQKPWEEETRDIGDGYGKMYMDRVQKPREGETIARQRDTKPSKPERTRHKRPEIQVYVPRGRRQQQHQQNSASEDRDRHQQHCSSEQPCLTEERAKRQLQNSPDQTSATVETSKYQHQQGQSSSQQKSAPGDRGKVISGEERDSPVSNAGDQGRKGRTWTGVGRGQRRSKQEREVYVPRHRRIQANNDVWVNSGEENSKEDPCEKVNSIEENAHKMKRGGQEDVAEEVRFAETSKRSVEGVVSCDETGTSRLESNENIIKMEEKPSECLGSADHHYSGKVDMEYLTCADDSASKHSPDRLSHSPKQVNKKLKTSKIKLKPSEIKFESSEMLAHDNQVPEALDSNKMEDRSEFVGKSQETHGINNDNEIKADGHVNLDDNLLTGQNFCAVEGDKQGSLVQAESISSSDEILDDYLLTSQGGNIHVSSDKIPDGHSQILPETAQRSVDDIRMDTEEVPCVSNLDVEIDHSDSANISESDPSAKITKHYSEAHDQRRTSLPLKETDDKSSTVDVSSRMHQIDEGTDFVRTENVCSAMNCDSNSNNVTESLISGKEVIHADLKASAATFTSEQELEKYEISSENSGGETANIEAAQLTGSVLTRYDDDSDTILTSINVSDSNNSRNVPINTCTSSTLTDSEVVGDSIKGTNNNRSSDHETSPDKSEDKAVDSVWHDTVETKVESSSENEKKAVDLVWLDAPETTVKDLPTDKEIISGPVIDDVADPLPGCAQEKKEVVFSVNNASYMYDTKNVQNDVNTYSSCNNSNVKLKEESPTCTTDCDGKEDKNKSETKSEMQTRVESGKEVPQVEEDAIDEDSWDALFDDEGECLDPSAMEELTKNVGKVKIKKTKINYLEYQPRDPELDYDSYGHIVEIYDFPAEFITRDLLTAFQGFQSKGFDLKWVDDTHALGVFTSPIAAQDALSTVHPLLKVRPLSEASRPSKMKAKRCTEFLQPYKARPETSATAARRLVAGALGLASRVPREKREQERQQLKEARAKKKLDRKAREDIWEGNVGKCAMDMEDS